MPWLLTTCTTSFPIVRKTSKEVASIVVDRLLKAGRVLDLGVMGGEISPDGITGSIDGWELGSMMAMLRMSCLPTALVWLV